MDRIISPNFTNCLSVLLTRSGKSTLFMVIKIVTVLFFLFGGESVSMAQQIKLNVTKDSTLVSGKYMYSITVNILEGKAPYNIEVYDNLRRDGGKLIAKEENYSRAVVTFSNLPLKIPLYISVECVKEKQGITTLIRL